MNLNNIGSTDYTSNLVSQIKGTNQSKEATNSTTKETTTTEDTGVVYEAGKSTEASATTKTKGKVDSATIAKLKEDADARLSQLKGIVEQLITKQGKASKNASIWDQFRQGVLDGSISVDAATAKQAAEDISEDGYWGVKQTSERIIDFAKALSGGDSSKAEEMRAAITKGFDAASKAWGGELPDISKQTQEAVMKGLDAWKNGEA